VDEEIKVKRLYISLSQNIGAPSVPCVKEGQEISRGELIAAAPEKALGLPIHAPVDAKVLKISDSTIILQSAERK
jgi:Na+-translocating ferredoxin:NAD+ oxidoreductase RnfC subunit